MMDYFLEILKRTNNRLRIKAFLHQESIGDRLVINDSDL